MLGMKIDETLLSGIYRLPHLDFGAPQDGALCFEYLNLLAWSLEPVWVSASTYQLVVTVFEG